MDNKVDEHFDFDAYICEAYASILKVPPMHMDPWRDEEIAAISRILCSEERARNFIGMLPILNDYIEKHVGQWPAETMPMMKVNYIANYLATSSVFLAVALSRNALDAYLHDQKRLNSPLDVTANDILSPDTAPDSLLLMLHALYDHLYDCPRNEYEFEYCKQVLEYLESYLDIALAVANDQEVRRLRDYLRDFFTNDYQPVVERPLTREQLDALPEKNFDKFARRWKDAACSYAISFANRNQTQTPVLAHVVSVDDKVKTSFFESVFTGLKSLIPTIVRKRANYGKRPDVSLERAASLTGLTVDQLRTVEKLPAKPQMGYPGRSGDNLAFVEKSLILWGEKYRSAKKAEKATQKGLASPIHHPAL